MNGKAVRMLILAVLLGVFHGPGVSALSLADLVGSEQANALIAGEKPVLAQFKNPEPQLIPRYGILRELSEAIRRDLGPSVMVETLHIYRKPEAAQKIIWSAEEESNLYNEVLALSTLAGLQYFSATRGAMRTFYETSRVIDGP
jgi:hypothetical protein